MSPPCVTHDFLGVVMLEYPSVLFRYLKLKNGEEDQKKYHWWHTKLADFFQGVSSIERKCEVWSVLSIFQSALGLVAGHAENTFPL